MCITEMLSILSADEINCSERNQIFEKKGRERRMGVKKSTKPMIKKIKIKKNNLSF